MDTTLTPASDHKRFCMAECPGVGYNCTRPKGHARDTHAAHEYLLPEWQPRGQPDPLNPEPIFTWPVDSQH